MRHRSKSLIIALFLAIASTWLIAAAPPALSGGAGILQYLNETVDWYHHVTAIDEPPVNSQELLLRESVRQNARNVVYYGFQFARAQAATLDLAPRTTQPSTSKPSTSKTARGRNIAQAALKVADHLAQLHSELDQINGEIANGSPDSASTLVAKRDRLTAEINLATAQNDTLQKYSAFMTDAESGDAASLAQRIDDLEQSAPDVQQNPHKSSESDTAASVSTATAAAAQPAYHPESSGIFSLISEMFGLSRRMRDIHVLTEQVAKLKQENDHLRDPIRAQLKEAIHRGDAIAATQESDDPNQLDAQREELDSLAARFKLLAEAGVPLGEQGVMLETAQQNLLAWHSAIASQYSSALRSLLIRLGVLALTILLLVGVSELWRRATFRYVADARRRRQLMLVRRIVIGVVVVMIVIASVVSEFSSLVTFAGLITAGIAVALQTVILSGVAYFFFIGRFGVRVGDRVTISGITGDVVEIGLFRIYLLELGGTRLDLHPTGRVVVFSNAVLFQPSAFYKQIPGADYVWHEVSFTLSPGTEHRLAEKRLVEAVESVFTKYRDVIDAQHASISSTMQEQMAPPRLESRLRFVDAGLEFVLRYPVEIRRAAEIDDEITRKLLDAIESEPKLKLVPSSPPRIQSAQAP